MKKLTFLAFSLILGAPAACEDAPPVSCEDSPAEGDACTGKQGCCPTTVDANGCCQGPPLVCEEDEWVVPEIYDCG